ncbi:TetR/AcrR family transcriptional regulator [Edaphobacter sp.]|uniref:TetR/AcrR family transcriptional regulator n=1 Tax=Edaphobacter sp. TaxID=1934404 RepID=UPI002DBDE506|nr:TetR/AcrR family transcriptional regulator [Edaphobacter sp.]HEU5341806.1 TetR/AcrR family transcriptional regulator [Edaphobacter sp.]
MTPIKPNPHQQDRSDLTRQKILAAAIREFSTHGLAGARTDAIAEAAKVNKALLYYYFKSKNSLYTAALEAVAGKIVQSAFAALDIKASAGELLLRAALNHFDRLLTQHEFQNLMQQEMVRFKQGKSQSIPVLARTVFTPMLERMKNLVKEGVRSGELLPVDWLQVLYSAFGANVFYFLSAPMVSLSLSVDPLTPANIAVRRKSVIEFLGNALFTDRAHGAGLAHRVLADMPMPKIKTLPAWRKHL